jgi:hypothetical protein
LVASKESNVTSARDREYITTGAAAYFDNELIGVIYNVILPNL